MIWRLADGGFSRAPKATVFNHQSLKRVFRNSEQAAVCEFVARNLAVRPNGVQLKPRQARIGAPPGSDAMKPPPCKGGTISGSHNIAIGFWGPRAHGFSVLDRLLPPFQGGLIGAVVPRAAPAIGLALGFLAAAVGVPGIGPGIILIVLFCMTIQFPNTFLYSGAPSARMYGRKGV